MKQLIYGLLCGAMVFILIIPMSFAQEDMVSIDNSVFGNPKRPPARFKHDEHNERARLEDCQTCHHVYENGKLLADESSEDQRCSDCHRQKGGDIKPVLMKAFHMKCKNCHQAQLKGPVMCGECHLKRNRVQ